MRELVYVDDFTVEDEDEYGVFSEYEVHLDGELFLEALDQLSDIYIPSEDSYIDVYVRRYRDSSTRLWLGVHEDFTKSGCFIEREMTVADFVYEYLNELDL